MDLPHLIAGLSRPSAYPHTAEVTAVEVRQTHISVVLLAGPYAYKVKKPVELGFVDYTRLEQRRRFCQREVELNRRLAPSVYLGVVPITRSAAGLEVEGEGEALEWAVKMVRLPEENTLRTRLQRGELAAASVEALARRLAGFHARAEGGAAVAAYGRFEVVAANARENLDQAAPHVGTTVSRAAFERVRALTESALAALQPLIEARASRGLTRDGHGDLRLAHIYQFPDRRPPEDLLIIDCIEFSDRFRCTDPVADAAFAAMDLARHGRRDLAGAFAAAYLEAMGDEDGARLLPFYTAYRAAVRGKVEGMELPEPEVPEPQRAAALVRARAHWLLALGELEQPSRRPGLVLVSGLPGAGKSTLARLLAQHAGFTMLRTDLVRKELAGVGSGATASAGFESGIYSPEWTERVYAECLRRAEARLFEGQRVLIDASFRTEPSRLMFLELAERWSVPAVLLHCQAEPEVVQARLLQRRDDASDADWAIYLHAASRWEPPGAQVQPVTRDIATGGSLEHSLAQALHALSQFRLWDADSGPAR